MPCCKESSPRRKPGSSTFNQLKRRCTAPAFSRTEGRELAGCYVTGLMMEGERKSVEPLSEKAGASQRSLQRLLTEVRWDEGG